MKAESRTFIITALIAVLVLAVVALFTFGKGSDTTIRKFDNLLPWFNLTKETEIPEVLRYNLVEQKVDIFDGVDFNPLNFEQQINDKNLKKDFLINDFETYYYNKNLREEIVKKELPEHLSGRIYDDFELFEKIDAKDSTAWPFNICIIDIQRSRDNFADKGDVTMKLIGNEEENCGGLSYGEITSSQDGKVRIRKIKSDISTLESEREEITNQEVIEKINSLALEWRNSILKTPITIHYFEPETNKPLENKFCIKDANSKFLLVDLSEPSESEKC